MTLKRPTVFIHFRIAELPTTPLTRYYNAGAGTYTLGESTFENESYNAFTKIGNLNTK